MRIKISEISVIYKYAQCMCTQPKVNASNILVSRINQGEGGAVNN